MIAKLQRAWAREKYTIGRFLIDGVRFCESMEDPDRGLTQEMPLKEIKKRKVYGETAIPKGTYNVTMTWSQKYKRNMPEVHDVPGFSGVRIHSGNTAEDSHGCILLGRNTQVGRVTNSSAICAEFERILEENGGVCQLIIE
jgi:hypothetical protein